MSKTRKDMMRKWNQTYGFSGEAVRGATRPPAKRGNRITEDDPRWPLMQQRKRERRHRQGVRRYTPAERKNLENQRPGRYSQRV